MMSITKDISQKFVSEYNDQHNETVVKTLIGDVTVLGIIASDVATTVVKTIVGACLSENNDYRPDLVDAVTRMVIISAYTDVDLPDEFDDKYVFVYASGVFEAVLSSINEFQLKAIMMSVDEALKYRIRSNFNVIESALMKTNTELEKTLAQFNDMYSNITGDDVKSLVGAISRTKLNEKKLVKAITDPSK